jgi:hypothetical protein
MIINNQIDHTNQWYELNVQTDTQEQKEHNDQTRIILYNWKNKNLSKHEVNYTVWDTCPYFSLHNLRVIGQFCLKFC